MKSVVVEAMCPDCGKFVRVWMKIRKEQIHYWHKIDGIVHEWDEESPCKDAPLSKGDSGEVMKTLTASPIGHHKKCGEIVYQSDSKPHKTFCFKCGDVKIVEVIAEP